MLVLVGDRKGDLGFAALANKACDRDGPRVALDVCDERVIGLVDRGELAEIGSAQTRLWPVEACATRLFAQAFEEAYFTVRTSPWRRGLTRSVSLPCFGLRTRVCMNSLRN
jgi:hypothetical protein